MNSSSSAHLYLVRHGETDWNKEGRIQGHADIPLNEIGYAQAMQLRQQLAHVSFSAACSSDLSRAYQTAEVVLNDCSFQMVKTPFLRERSNGALEGMSFVDYQKLIRPFFESSHALEKESYFDLPWHPEIESSSAILQRVIRFLCTYASSYPKQTLLAVSHGGVLRTFLDHFHFSPKKRWVASNCGFLQLKIDRESVKLIDYEGISQEEI